jgi:hypothetical protein
VLLLREKKESTVWQMTWIFVLNGFLMWHEKKKNLT